MFLFSLKHAILFESLSNHPELHDHEVQQILLHRLKSWLWPWEYCISHACKKSFSWKTTETLGKLSALSDHRKPFYCRFVCPYSVRSTTFEHTHSSLRNWKLRCGKKKGKNRVQYVYLESLGLWLTSTTASVAFT